MTFDCARNLPIVCLDLIRPIGCDTSDCGKQQLTKSSFRLLISLPWSLLSVSTRHLSSNSLTSADWMLCGSCVTDCACFYCCDAKNVSELPVKFLKCLLVAALARFSHAARVDPICNSIPLCLLTMSRPINNWCCRLFVIKLFLLTSNSYCSEPDK